MLNEIYYVGSFEYQRTLIIFMHQIVKIPYAYRPLQSQMSFNLLTIRWDIVSCICPYIIVSKSVS